MNQVEVWFSLLHRRALRRGVFRNLGSLVTAIHRFMEAWNNIQLSPSHRAVLQTWSRSRGWGGS